MSSGGGQQQASNQITSAGQTAYGESEMTPEEQQQYQQSFGTGNLLNQAMQYQMGGGQQPAGYQSPTQQYLQQTGPLGQGLYNQAANAVQNPYANYISTLQPSLMQAQNYINEGDQQRGLLQSGIDIGNMGQAGVQLAIQQAQGMMNAYQQSMNQGQNMAGNIQNTGQQNLSNLNQLYGQQQGYGLTGQQRQATAANNNAQYQAYPGQAALGNYYANQGNLGAGIGGLAGGAAGLGIGAALAPATGGMSLAIPLASAAMGYGAGSQLGRSAF